MNEQGFHIFETTKDQQNTQLKGKIAKLEQDGRQKRGGIEFVKKFFRFLRIPKHAIVQFAKEQVESGIFSINRVASFALSAKPSITITNSQSLKLKEKANRRTFTER